MNKESIYKIIGYNGEYNTSVKKAIRKLLKENHPDNNGDRRIFELINEVKQELENNKVSINTTKKETKNNDGIDHVYCSKMIDLTKKEKKKYESLLAEKKNELNKYENMYRDLYRNNIETESSLLLSSLNKKRLNSIKILVIIFLIASLILFSVAISEKSIVFFAIFVLVTMICILIIQKYLINTQKIMNFSSKNLKEYIKSNSELRKNTEKQKELKIEIQEINKKVSNLDNDLRFYSNLLK